MPDFNLPYGSLTQSVSIPDLSRPVLILPHNAPAADDPSQTVSIAVDHPLQFDWSRIQPGDSVAITVNDKTRPVPNYILLPPLLARLTQADVSREKIIIWIATGSHTPMSADEFPRILPPSILDTYTVRSHEVDNTENLVFIGTTQRGTPVWVNRLFYEADIKIVVGDIEPHHFAGFSGGYKSAAIGMAGRPTVNHNHKMLTDPKAWIGIFDENPLRQDIEEIGALIGVDLAVNAVLNQDKEIVTVFCGHPAEVIRRAIPKVWECCETVQNEKFDLVIASAGGHPKDINFYQAQKALTHASLFCKAGGTILLAAACPEGSGNQAYEEFMSRVTTIDEVFKEFAAQEFRVGPHKAFQVGRLLTKFEIILVSDMPDDLVRRLMLQPSHSIQKVLDDYLASHSGTSRIAVLPHATTTLAR